MASYTQGDIFGEISNYFRGSIEADRIGSTIDPVSAHQQVMEIAKVVFFLRPAAFYHLARLVRNSLSIVRIQEQRIVEDMLVLLENLYRPENVDQLETLGTEELGNAITAVVSLENAGTVKDRPELTRFLDIINRFTGILAPATTSNGQLVFPRGEARGNLQINLERLKVLHPRTIEIATNLEAMKEVYASVDFPSRVSRDTLANVRRALEELREEIERSTSERNVANSRFYLLRGLSLRVVVRLLESYLDASPTTATLTSANEGTAARGAAGQPGGANGGPDSVVDGPYLARAAGEGTPAEAATFSGPWALSDLDQTEVRLKVDGGDEQVFDLTSIKGPGIHAANAPPFTDEQITPIITYPTPGPGDPPPPPIEQFEDRNLMHFVADPNGYEFTCEEFFFRDHLSEWSQQFTISAASPSRVTGTFRVRMTPSQKLGFKHLGTPVYFTLTDDVGPFGGWEIDEESQLSDPEKWGEVNKYRWPYLFKPRVLTELGLLHDLSGIAHTGSEIFVSPDGVFLDWYVGFYLRTPGNHRYEIVEVIDENTIRLDTRGEPLSNITTLGCRIFGVKNDSVEIEFAPSLLADTNKVAESPSLGPFDLPTSAKVTIGPAVKTAQIPEGSGTDIATLLSALNSPPEIPLVGETIPRPGLVGPPHTKALGQPWTHASYHFKFLEQPGFAGKLTAQARSAWEPQPSVSSDMAAVSLFLKDGERDDDESPVDFPGPQDLKSLQQTAYEVVGLEIGQSTNEEDDLFMEVSELEAVISETIEGATTSTVEQDITDGTGETVPGTKAFRDTTKNFTALGIGKGYLLEIQEGDYADTYVILSAGTNDLFVSLPGGAGFVGLQKDIPYRVIQSSLKITSDTPGPGSSIEVTLAPSVLGFPSEVQNGVVPEVEAVNEDGDLMDLSGVEVGDTFNGQRVSAVSEDGTRLELDGGVSADLEGEVFEVSGSAQDAFAQMESDLETLLTSENLLRKHNFDVTLDELERSITPLLSPGQTFQASIRTSQDLLADMLSTLTSSPSRSAEYPSVDVPVAVLNMEDSISEYTAPDVGALDELLQALDDQGFDRALTLLLTGALVDFFETSFESASLAGNLQETARAVKNDFPADSALLHRVEEVTNQSTGFVTVVDADVDFSDANAPVDER